MGGVTGSSFYSSGSRLSSRFDDRKGAFVDAQLSVDVLDVIENGVEGDEEFALLSLFLNPAAMRVRTSSSRLLRGSANA